MVPISWEFILQLVQGLGKLQSRSRGCPGPSQCPGGAQPGFGQHIEVSAPLRGNLGFAGLAFLPEFVGLLCSALSSSDVFLFSGPDGRTGG